MARTVRTLLALTAVALAVVLVSRTGIVDHVRDEDRLRDTVEGAGPLGPLLFVALMVVLVPLNVPGLLLVVPSTTLFGPPGGVALSLAGGFLASAVGILGARRLGRATVEARLPASIRRLEARVSARGFWGVVALRSCTFLLQPVDWLCGLSSMPTRTVLAATFVGLVPPTLVVTLGGDRLLGGLL